MNRSKQSKMVGVVLAICAFLFAFFPEVSSGQNVEVSAKLSQPHTAVGEVVELTISVSGARYAKVPDNFVLDGLPIVSRGQSTQVSIVNFQMTTTTVYTYLLRPEREGSFTIPSLAIEVGGQTYSTKPVQLEVRGVATVSPGQGTPSSRLPGGANAGQVQRQRNPRQQQQQGGQQQVPIDQIAKMEVLFSQKEAYVGQMIPVELRVYFDTRFQFELSQMPVFSGEGFIGEKLSEPEERREVIGGVPFQVVTFRTAITPVKAGALVVKPAEMACSVVLPGSGRMGMGSLFDDFFGGDPFGGMMGERRELTLKSGEVSLKVKNLPKEGKPLDFAGAIGQFTLAQRMEPARAEIGEPMKLITDIRGQGNFGSIVQPTLENTDGWRTYSGGDKFTANDASGFGGSKVFDTTVMPMREVRESPVAVFSYFDPVKEAYVTLRGEAQPVLIRGGKVPATAAKSPVSGDGKVASTPTPQATPVVAEGQVSSEDGAGKTELVPLAMGEVGSFQAVPFRLNYLAANGIALVVFLGFLSFVGLRKKRGGVSGKLAKMKREQAQILQVLGEPNLGSKEFFAKAEEFIRRQQRVAAGDPEFAWDESRLAGDERLSQELRGELAKIFDWNNELKFSSRSQEPGVGQREATVAALRALMKQLN